MNSLKLVAFLVLALTVSLFGSVAHSESVTIQRVDDTQVAQAIGIVMQDAEDGPVLRGELLRLRSLSGYRESKEFLVNQDDPNMVSVIWWFESSDGFPTQFIMATVDLSTRQSLGLTMS